MTTTTRALVAVIAGLIAAQAAPIAQGGSDLTKLTVPASQLPEGCRLIPGPRAFLKTNPSEVTDPQQTGFIHSLMFGQQPTDAANLAARGATVVVGYAAAYEEKNGAHEIGVYALRMKDPAAVKNARGPSAARSFTITKGSVVIYVWADILPGRKELGCLDVIRKHIESVRLK